jgi:FMN-dependent NADH-azoreductase
MNLLRIDSSARRTGSVSRDLTDRVIARLAPDAEVITRDLADGITFIDEAWIAANFTPSEQRDAGQRRALALSDDLVAELKAADLLVIGLPLYNFGVPAAFKAWVDLVARAGETFRYSESGPKGLLEGKRAIVAVTSGGTEAGSDLDFATGYVRHVLGFIGIADVTVVAADRLMLDAEGTMDKALAEIEALPAVA